MEYQSPLDDPLADSTKSNDDQASRANKDFTPLRKISGTQAEYTEEARRAKYNGKVTVGLIVDPAGDVQKVWVVSPASYGLTQASVESVSAWKFQPATKNGQAVAVPIEVEFTFNIYDGPKYR